MPAAVSALPDPKVASDQLFDLQARAFFGRLAQYGRQPTNEKQAEEYIKLAGKLRLAEERFPGQQTKVANDPIAEASSALDRVMGNNTAAADVSRRQMSVKLAGDADLYNAVLSCKAAEAVQVAQEIGL